MDSYSWGIRSLGGLQAAAAFWGVVELWLPTHWGLRSTLLEQQWWTYFLLLNAISSLLILARVRSHELLASVLLLGQVVVLLSWSADLPRLTPLVCYYLVAFFLFYNILSWKVRSEAFQQAILGKRAFDR